MWHASTTSARAKASGTCFGRAALHGWEPVLNVRALWELWALSLHQEAIACFQRRFKKTVRGWLWVVLRHFVLFCFFCLHRSFRQNCFWKQERQMKATLGFFNKLKTDRNTVLLQN